MIFQVLVDGPSTGVKRQQITVNGSCCILPLQVARLYLTDFVVPLNRGAKTTEVDEAFKAGEVENKWNETAWAKKLAARAKKASMCDFCRFKARFAKKH